MNYAEQQNWVEASLRASVLSENYNNRAQHDKDDFSPDVKLSIHELQRGAITCRFSSTHYGNTLIIVQKLHSKNEVQN